jgi:2-hydroxy-6-oxonona-2,4-dienedioate hydrolase
MRAFFQDVQGLRTRFFRAGSGPLLVLVHPVGYPAEIFARNIDALAERHTVIAPDLPGQGFSAAPDSWQGAPQSFMARHVLALARDLGFEQFSVLGSSLGGLVAALVALHAPQVVEKLVVVGSGSVFNEPSGQSAVLQNVMANGSRAYQNPSLDACRTRMANTCFRAPAADDIHLAHITAYALPGAEAAYRSIIQGLSATAGDPACTVYPHLEEIRAQTLVVLGRNDVRTSVQSHDAGVRRMRDARLLVLDDCGHLPFLEVPGVFNASVAEFLQSGTTSR